MSTDLARPARVKPRLRGVLHEAAFYVALALVAPLVASAPTGRARIAAAIFAGTAAAMFGSSALYHRVTWRPRARRWLCRLDHAALYSLIAGTYTPWCLLVLRGDWRIVMLALIWGGCAALILLKAVWYDLPKWAAAASAIALGAIGIVAVPQLASIGAVGLSLFALGGVFYTVGAVIYARRRPDPVPAVFGYHELFHALVVAAATCEYVVVAFWILPRR